MATAHGTGTGPNTIILKYNCLKLFHVNLLYLDYFSSMSVFDIVYCIDIL